MCCIAYQNGAIAHVLQLVVQVSPATSDAENSDEEESEETKVKRFIFTVFVLGTCLM